ncbi:MAG: nuclear transport factor 2 family protein [Eudoraea sp.]|uniref:YybH family protein n=1 Tax=Eudoraea sp. TaxID=1979955 RepID=UPI003C7389F7
MTFTSSANKLTNLALIVFLTFALVSCNQSKNKGNQFDLENAKSEITSRLRAYEDALVNGDKAAFGNLYTEDAEIFHDGSPSTISRRNIVKVFEGWVRDSVTGNYTTTGLWGNKDLLVEQGTGYFAHATGKWKASGKYLLVWKKVDGEWKIFRDTWFADPKVEE